MPPPLVDIRIRQFDDGHWEVEVTEWANREPVKDDTYAATNVVTLRGTG